MNDIFKPPMRNLKRRPRGFTLIEILVVIGIIVILLAIAIPVVGRVRKAAQVATVQAQISDLQGAIQLYQQDYGALPGPIMNANIRDDTFAMTIDTSAPNVADFMTTGWDPEKITMSENLVLALYGGLEALTVNGATTFRYDPTLVGGGAMSLNPGNPKKGRTYLDGKNLSWREEDGKKTGKYKDNAGEADDTLIPEIVDTFSSPMPILYLRARKGQQPPAIQVNSWDADDNFIITHDTATPPRRVGQYDTSQYLGYVTPPVANAGFIGEGKSISAGDYKPSKTLAAGQFPHGLTPPPADLNVSMDKGAANYEYPYNAYNYFRDPSSSTTNPQPRSKDGYILISAGLDRIYGTTDDITSFGPVAP